METRPRIWSRRSTPCICLLYSFTHAGAGNVCAVPPTCRSTVPIEDGSAFEILCTILPSHHEAACIPCSSETPWRKSPRLASFLSNTGCFGKCLLVFLTVPRAKCTTRVQTFQI
ncbi:hypothetical protein PF008_g7621 [Phytophthora fragariae]|uniref:Secreted protein n=1 Tax=Phytophthora fragariae TaxID=53985 RepID=A0A6G0S2Z4_9STRA|nr:hypothetical protein PF008_g7621 [Phytophthora fragariae]